MYKIKPLTIDDIHKLKGYAREEALITYQEARKRSWKQTRKEMISVDKRIRRINYIHQGKCSECGKKRENKDKTKCNKCLKRNNEWQHNKCQSAKQSGSRK